MNAIISGLLSYTAALISAILSWILRQLVYKYVIVCSLNSRRRGHFAVYTDE